jgi:hypothetical protein
MRSKTPKQRVKAALRDDRAPPSRAHQTWAMDFVHDQLATGSKLRILTIAEVFSRFFSTIDPRCPCADGVQTIRLRCVRPKAWPRTHHARL